jgi:outer membrane lipoprotein SlyB
MKTRLILAAPLAAALSLGGCSTLNTQTANFLGEVQAFAAQAFKFVPDIATILALYNAGIGTSVGAIGTAVCALVPPPASARYKALAPHQAGVVPSTIGTIGNVVISGWRTQ